MLLDPVDSYCDAGVWLHPISMSARNAVTKLAVKSLPIGVLRLVIIFRVVSVVRGLMMTMLLVVVVELLQTRLMV